jgi:mono/diheme cytochrome c family protein
MKAIVISVIAVCLCIALASNALMPPFSNEWNSETPVYELLLAFGEELPDHARPAADEATIQRGYNLIYKGKATSPEGKPGTFISKFYKCTTCHNQLQEDPVLTEFNPEKRLDYVAKNNMKFLQGSTFYGIANRESWYNEDYYLKYGDLVKPANKSLAEATQLCAKVCSSGRYLEDWELEAILAYYWNNQIKLVDLKLTDEQLNDLMRAEQSSNPEMIKLLKSKYALYSPATFGEGPENMSEGFPYEGRAENGKKIFELSCQSCHSYQGVSGLEFDDSKLTFQKFKRNLDKSDDYNIYEISRHGTYVDKGKPRYMPLYPKERLSDRQLEDLKAYILQQAS